MRSLVVVTHPVETSLTRAAFDRVCRGLDRAGGEVRVIDLDAIDFDPCLSVDEKRRHLDDPATKPAIADHVEALQWAERLILVYPTWYGGFPAVLKGWFDRTWVTGVAYHLPEGSGRIRAGLRNIRRLDIVTSHGSSRWVNLAQRNPGKLTAFRTLRLLCHPLCRRRWTALYDVDRQSPSDIETWLDLVEQRYAT